MKYSTSHTDRLYKIKAGNPYCLWRIKKIISCIWITSRSSPIVHSVALVRRWNSLILSQKLFFFDHINLGLPIELVSLKHWSILWNTFCNLQLNSLISTFLFLFLSSFFFLFTLKNLWHKEKRTNIMKVYKN